jgi:hypothetical protein
MKKQTKQQKLYGTLRGFTKTLIGIGIFLLLFGLIMLFSNVISFVVYGFSDKSLPWWSFLIITLVIYVFGGWIILRNKKKKKQTKKQDTSKTNQNGSLKGLGGWLVFTQIGLWLAIISYLIYFILIFLSLLESEAILITGSYLLLAALTGYSIFLMYTKNKKFPIFMIILLWLSFLHYLTTSVLGLFGQVEILSTISEYGKFIGRIILRIIPASLWTAYFIKSKRVKNTFVK